MNDITVSIKQYITVIATHGRKEGLTKKCKTLEIHAYIATALINLVVVAKLEKHGKVRFVRPPIRLHAQNIGQAAR